MAKRTEEISHKDMLGQDLQIGSIVVAPRDYGGKKAVIAKVNKIHPKMVSLNIIGTSWSFLLYPHDLVLVEDNPNLPLYVLKANSKA